MIAPLTPIEPRRDDLDARLAAVSAEQDRLRDRDEPATFTQGELGRRLGVTRARIEQIELLAKLRFLKRLAGVSPQTLLELGATWEHIAFLRSATLTPSRARSLWTRWCRLGDREDDDAR
ncbi:MAG: hypothetical protein ACOC7R_00345 [Planctomycetota bacterium]